MSSTILKIISGVLFFHQMALQSYAQTGNSENQYFGKTDTGMVNRLNEKAISFIQINLDSTRYYALAAKDMSRQINYTFGAARASLHLSNYYNNKGDYKLAMTNALEALRIFDSLNLNVATGDVYAQLAYIYKAMASQNRTPAYLNTGVYNSRMAYEKYLTARDTAGMANSLNITGILYRDKYYAESNKFFFDTAFICYQQALNLIEISGKGEQYTGKLFNNISQVYNEYKGDYKTALAYLFKAVEFNKLHNNQVSLLYNYGNISSNYRQLKDYDHALQYAGKMLAGAGELEHPNRRHDALYELFKNYEKKGQYKEALHYYLLADRITDSLSNIEKTRQVAELRAGYEAEKNEMEIQQLTKDKQNIAKRNLILSAGLALLFLLAVGLVILYRRVQNQKKEISLQSEKLTTMMRELHHRIKNNLQIVSSLLSLQSYKTDDQRAISAFRESRQRIHAMGLIHQKLYNTGNAMTVDMKEYITDLVNSLLVAFGYHDKKMNLDIVVEKETLDVDKALPIGLIINEIITNSLKHAFAHVESPELFISLTEDHRHLFVKVKDNGEGIDMDSWENKSKSFGKQLIGALSTQLRAQQEISVTAGTLFTITIPKDAAA